jgi:hypothetical protein
MFRKCLISTLALLGGSLALADTLLLDGIDMAASTSAERPTRGTTMATVEQRFGTPTDKLTAIGEPPITRWEYPGYTVFFEYEHVLHTVVRH